MVYNTPRHFKLMNNQKVLTIIKEVVLGLLSFAIPFVLLIILCSVNGFALFNYSNRTMMMLDMNSQYITFMNYYRNLLLGNGNFIYTTSKVFGGDFLSIYTFYLASPFNLFIVFFKQEAIPLFFLWSSILKMSFASLNMYLLTRLIAKFKYQRLIAAIGYGLISYSFIYMSNYMWLDGVMILPLVVLGMHYLKDKKHLWLYPVALAYSLLTSWYTGFMICIFAVLYFIVLFFKDFQRETMKENLIFMARFAIFSLLGGLIAAPFWFTAFIHLTGTKGTSAFPESSFFSLSMLLSGFLENNYSSLDLITQNDSYITMFVGMVPLVFGIMFFANNKYTTRERLLYGAVLGFYLICSLNTVLYTLLHGGREPTWFPGRYSFIIGFLVCFLADRCLDEADSITPIRYVAPTLVGIISIIILTSIKHSERLALYSISVPSAVMYFVAIAVGAVYSFINTTSILKGKAFELIKKYSFILISCLVVVEAISSYRGADKVFKLNIDNRLYATYETYLKDVGYVDTFERIKTYEKEHDNSAFYRMEATFNRPGNYNGIDNNPFFYSYAGLSNFSSSSKKDVEDYASKVGFQYNWFWVNYDGGSTYAINSLFGVKYLIEDKTNYTNIHPKFLDCGAFSKLDIDSDIVYYQNAHATTIAFASDKTSATFVNEGERQADGSVRWFDKFEYQNEMFKTFNHGVGKDIFTPLEITSHSTSLAYEVDAFGDKTYKNVKSGNYIEIAFKVQPEGYNNPLYFSEKEGTGDVNYYIDGNRYEVNTYWHKGIYSFTDTTTHNHTLKIVFNKDFESVKLRPELYYENLNNTFEYLDAINRYQVTVDKSVKTLTKGGYSGTFNLNETTDSDLIFTLPYEKEMHVKVDGKEVKTYKRCNVFTAIDLTGLDKGTHTYSIYYQDTGLLVGDILFVVSLASMVPLIIFYKKIEAFVFYRKREEENKDQN